MLRSKARIDRAGKHACANQLFKPIRARTMHPKEVDPDEGQV
jgi:hypothetical protein